MSWVYSSCSPRKRVVQLGLEHGQHICAFDIKHASHREHSFYWKAVKRNSLFSKDEIFAENSDPITSEVSHRDRANYIDHLGGCPPFRELTKRKVKDRVRHISQIEISGLAAPCRDTYPDVRAVQILAYHRLVRFRTFVDEAIGGGNRFWDFHREPGWCRASLISSSLRPGVWAPWMTSYEVHGLETSDAPERPWTPPRPAGPQVRQIRGSVRRLRRGGCACRCDEERARGCLRPPAVSALLSGAVIERTHELDWRATWDAWLKRASGLVGATRSPSVTRITRVCVARAGHGAAIKRDDRSPTPTAGIISARAALWIDALRLAVPRRGPARTPAIAALIRAASQCAAAPGHTCAAVPADEDGQPFIAESWAKDVVARTLSEFRQLAPLFAMKRGRGPRCAGRELRREGIARKRLGVHRPAILRRALQPVLSRPVETIVRGNCGEVSGAGRYPCRNSGRDPDTA